MYLGYLSSEGSQVAFETFLSLFFSSPEFLCRGVRPTFRVGALSARCRTAQALRIAHAREPAAQYHARMTLRARATLARVGSVEIKA